MKPNEIFDFAEVPIVSESIATGPPPARMDCRYQHLCRVIKKRRIAKHSNAFEVYVSLGRTRERAYLVIRDNGQALAIGQSWTNLFISDIVDWPMPAA